MSNALASEKLQFFMRGEKCSEQIHGSNGKRAEMNTGHWPQFASYTTI